MTDEKITEKEVNYSMNYEKLAKTFENVNTTAIVATEVSHHGTTRIAIQLNATKPDFLFRKHFYLYENFESSLLDVAAILKKANKIVFDTEETGNFIRRYFTDFDDYVFFYDFAKEIIPKEQFKIIGISTSAFDIYSLLFNEAKEYQDEFTLFEYTECMRKAINGLLLHCTMRNKFKFSPKKDSFYLDYAERVMKENKKFAVVNYVKNNENEQLAAVKIDTAQERIFIGTDDEDSRKLLKEFFSDVDVLILYDNEKEILEYLSRCHKGIPYVFSIINISQMQKEILGESDLNILWLLSFYCLGFDYLYKFCGIESLREYYTLVHLILNEYRKMK